MLIQVKYKYNMCMEKKNLTKRLFSNVKHNIKIPFSIFYPSLVFYSIFYSTHLLTLLQ